MVADTPSVKNFAALPAPRASCFTCDCICAAGISHNKLPGYSTFKLRIWDIVHKMSDAKPLSCSLPELTSGSASPFDAKVFAPMPVACARGAHAGPAPLCEASLANSAAPLEIAFISPAAGCF